MKYNVSHPCLPLFFLFLLCSPPTLFANPERQNPFEPWATVKESEHERLALPLNAYRIIGYVSGPDTKVVVTQTPSGTVFLLKKGQLLGKEKFGFSHLVTVGTMKKAVFVKTVTNLNGEKETQTKLKAIIEESTR